MNAALAVADVDLGHIAVGAPIAFAALLVLWLAWRERGEASAIDGGEGGALGSGSGTP